MLITRGKHAGKTGRLMQFANNWISVDIPGAPGSIVSPRHVRLDEPDEFERFEESQGNDRVGQFWNEWVLEDDGTFSRNTERAPR